MLVKAGQLVEYDTGYTREIGKVKRINPRDKTSAFVWYHSGDTAACTLMEYLRPIDEQYARAHRDEFDNAYALEDIIAKQIENTAEGEEGEI